MVRNGSAGYNPLVSWNSLLTGRLEVRHAARVLVVSLRFFSSAFRLHARSSPPRRRKDSSSSRISSSTPCLLVDPESRREVAKIVVGVNGHEVTVSKDGHFAYVPIYGNAGVGKPGTDGTSIDVVDIRERKLAYTIDLGKASAPA